MRGNLPLAILLLIATVIFIAGSVFATIYPGELGYGCEGNPCPAWVNLTKGDMFFADDNQVFIVVKYTCNETSVCNESMIVTGDFSDIGGSSNVVGVFKENATDGSWAIFELNDTVNFSAYPGSVPFEVTGEFIFLNATDGNTSNDYFNDELNASVFLVNMSYPSGCPPPSEPLPPQIPLFNGTLVDIGACWVNCTVEDRAQIMNSTHYALCGPSFGGDTTNFTALADTGNFSNFNFVIHILGKVKVNFTQNISADPSICEFAMNTMAGPYFGINDTEWNGTNKPDLNVSAIITFYNVTERFGFQGRPQIFRYPHFETAGVPCPPSICSDFVWDGENITFSVTSFSDYGMTDAINVTLETPTNLSYVSTKNINFTFTPEWNSSANLHNCTLFGNFTGTWAKNETNQTPLVNGVVNGINNIVANEGEAYLWNVYCYNDSSQYDFYVINWTAIINITKPNWFNNNSVTPTNYSSTTLSQFNVTWNDTISAIDTVLITIRNSTGVLVNNDSMTNTTYGGQIYNYSIVLPVGTFNWTSYANDSDGNWNSTDTWTFTISKGDNAVTLYFNATPNSNKTYTYPSAVNATATAGGTVYLYRNGTHITNGTSPQSEDILLGNNTYPYKVNATGNTNYSDNTTGVTYYAFVNKGTLNLSLSASPSNSVNYPVETTVTGTENNIGDNDTLYELWRDSTLVDNTTPYQEVDSLNAGTYVYRFNSTGGENWTADLTGTTLTVTVTGTTFVPGGGGGTIPIPTHVTRVPGKAEITIRSISANRTVNITIFKTEDIAIRKLSISVLNTVNNMRITITKLSGMPATISHGIEGKVYHYINIEKGNFTDSDINRTIIRFAVNKTWMTQNRVNHTNISLYRWENINWNELPTSYVSEDAFEYYYESESPGFSVFTIGTSGGSFEVEEELPEVTEEVNQTEEAEPEILETVPEEISPVIIVAIALVIVVIIVLLILFKTKGIIFKKQPVHQDLY